MELAYRQVADYLIPDIQMDAQPEGHIGKYGMLRKTFLKNHRKGTYSGLLLTNGLTAHLLEVDREAREQVALFVKQIAKTEGVTEQLKAENQLLWVGKMESIRNRAEEMIMAELIYS